MRPVHRIVVLLALGCFTGCGMAQQTFLNDSLTAEPGRAPVPAGLRASNPEMFTCAEDSDCVAAPKSGCNNGIIEAVRRDSAKEYVRLARQQRTGGCAFIWVEDRRVAHCHPDRRQCELTTASSETP